jgi:hypothetical protein
MTEYNMTQIVYEEGHKACQDGKDFFEDNPYADNDDKTFQLEWEEGFCDAEAGIHYYKDEKL